MRAYNRYGCVPNVRCACPVSFARCSAWTTLKSLAEAGDPQAVADLAAAEAETEKRRAAYR